MTAPTLTEFLTARLDEDEATIRGTLDAGDATTFDHDRMLAECEAKRRIVERHSCCDEVSFGDASTCPDMRDLALPYADHPDWREEWRP